MDEAHLEVEEENYSKTLLGFWLYILTDFVLFATLFAVFLVLRNKTFGGPTPHDIFDLPYSLAQSFILLGASFTSGMGGAYAHRREKRGTIFWFLVTAFLGVTFLALEVLEFKQLLDLGGKWNVSAFLSAFWTLVGTHSVHVIFAILWVPLLLWEVWKDGVNLRNLRRLSCLRMFWQFLNVIWIFVYVVVYLMGGL